MENFTPFSALLGGLLIGTSASIMLLVHGRIAGITGILSGALDPLTAAPERVWRLWFLGGLLLGGAILALASPERFVLGIERNTVELIVAGALVGWGTRLGSGCTSGHGVCGISRGSRRSIVATLTFIAAGALSVVLRRALLGEV